MQNSISNWESAPPLMRGAALRLAGKVTADPIQWDVQNLSLAFTLGEGEARIPVRFNGLSVVSEKMDIRFARHLYP